MKYRQFIWFLSFFLIVSCAGNKIVNNANGKKGIIVNKEEGFNPVPFILGPGDEITINVWRNDDLNRDVQIDPSGNIYLPLVGEIKASGLTIAQLRGNITSKLSNYFYDPQIDINVLTLKSQKVHVFGEVQSPGTYTIDQNLFAWEAISKAGGFTSDANRKKVLLVRSKDGVPTVAALNIQDMLKKGKMVQDVYLRSGDIIYVTPSFIANLERFMSRFNTIISPFVSLERGIVLYPDARDVLRGEEDPNIIITP
jgi:polysaccharide export outer membrane protein